MYPLKKFLTREKLTYFLLLNLGIAITAAGVHFFKAPNHFAMGGTSGISIIAATLFPKLNVGDFMFLVNAALVALSTSYLGSPIFTSARQVLDELDLTQIVRLVQEYQRRFEEVAR